MRDLIQRAFLLGKEKRSIKDFSRHRQST